MTAQINTDFVNHLVPLTTESSTSLVRVGTDACESKINFILRYKDYDSHKNAHKDFQKRFVDNPFGHGCSICDRLWFRDDLRTPRSGIGGNEDDIEELIMGHEDELTIEELQEILNGEHQETQRNVSPSEQEEDEIGPMPTSAIKDLLKSGRLLKQGS
ncbi:uncharacterized protein TNCV_245561 [Trichonephila clavipes]|nr:uncharacterized protein TNCV_245561 [Trichonephila clavipes]